MLYTVRSDETEIKWGLAGAERIVQNVRNILRTYEGEVKFMPGIGFDPEYIDGRLEALRQDVTDRISEQLKEYENRAELVSATVETVNENHDIVIVVELEVG